MPPKLTPQEYERASDLFNQLREIPASQRDSFLIAECAGNNALQSQVLRMLDADRGAGAFLQKSALEDAALLIAPEAANLPAPGTVIGNYRLGARIGAGGMGVVFEGLDLRLQRRVAIKILPSPFSGETADRVKRFQQEARAASLLNHPNIVSILDADFDGGHYYMAMEFVEGRTLRRSISEQPQGLDAKTLLDVISQAASALNAAHQAGIVHRDIKPENIMVRPDGFVKVLDFGLAKLRQPSSDPLLPDSELKTRPGIRAGTIQYLSPEQVAGKAVDGRSDLFSLGVVFYELATGVRPFEGPADGAIYDAILHHNPPAPSSLAPALSREVDGLILRSIEKEPELRFQTASDLRSSCKRLSRDLSSSSSLVAPTATVARRRSGARDWKAATAILTAALVVTLGILWRKPLHLSGGPLLRLDLDVGEEVSQFAISPDGLQLALVSGNRLGIRRLDQAERTPLEGAEGASFPFFSPDGQWVAFFAGRKLQKIAVAGGAPVVLCDAPSARGGSWGDDGNIVAALSSTGGLYRVSSSGGAPELLADVKDDGQGFNGYRWPQVLPGGKGILFTANIAGSTVGSLRVLSLRDRTVKTLVEHSAYGRYLAGGHLVYGQRGRLFTAPIDLDHLCLTGPAAPLVDGVASDTARGAIFESSVSGTLVYRRAEPGTGSMLSWRDSAGRSEPIPAPPAAYVMPRLSADGKRLALTIADEALHNIWIYDFGRKAISRLTFDTEPQFLGFWSPDSQFVVFRSGPSLAWIRSDGGGKLERLSAPVHYPLPNGFSPDGKWLLMAADDPATGWDLWVAPASESGDSLQLGTPRPLLRQPGGQYAPAISPDGRWMAYSSDESGRGEIYVVPFSPEGPQRNGKWQVSRDGGIYPVWSPRGRELFFRSADRHVMAARCEARGDSFVPGPPRVWTAQRLDAASGFPSFDVARDGRVVGIFETGPDVPETHLRVLLNVNDELRRRERGKGD